MKNVRSRVLIISILFIIPLAMAPFGYCGEPPNSNTEKLVGPSIDAVLVLRHTPYNPSNCNTHIDGMIEALLFGICNGNPFQLEYSCGSTPPMALPGNLAQVVEDPTYLTDPTRGQLKLGVPAICNPKPGQSLVVVDVKEYEYSSYFDQFVAKVTLMFVEPR